MLRFGLYSDRPGCLSPCLCGLRLVWERAGCALQEADVFWYLGWILGWFARDAGVVSAKVKLLWFSNLPGGSWQVSLLSRLRKVGWSGWSGCVVVCFKQASGACTLEVLRLVCSGLKLARGFLQVNLFSGWRGLVVAGCFLKSPSAPKGCEGLLQLASSRVGRSLCQRSVCRTWRDC